MEQIPHFLEELGHLKERLLAMGGLAEGRLRGAIRAIIERDADLATAIVESDEPVNQLHIEIDSRCLKLIALHQPVASDLRSIVAGLKINTDLERVGDLAVNIAEAVRRYLQHPPVKQLLQFGVRVVSLICHGAVSPLQSVS